MSPRQSTETVRVGGRRIEIRHPEKVLFAPETITKRDLAEYYQRIAATMLPYLRGRAIVMERYPDGIAGQRIIQKNTPAYFPDWMKTVSLPKKGGVVRHVLCEDAASLVYLAGQAAITPHTWLSRVDRPEQPDQLIFDLDPSGADFRAVCQAAKALRQRLREHRLTAFVKTTGSRGLHVLVPLHRGPEFDQVRAFARRIAEDLARSDPRHLTTEVRKNQRKGRIFVDTARNAYAQTAAPPYAVRAREGAPVAVPLAWEELEDRRLQPDLYNIRNVFDRLGKIGDPWRDVTRHARALSG